jgi:pyruvate dehydrogenase E2 component (dihydrolipoamide acetyltransferase)
VLGRIAATREEYELLVAARPEPAGLPAAQSELFLDYIRATSERAPTTPTSPSAARTRDRATPARKISPRARALIARAGLGADVVETIEATGPEGRLTDKDVQAFLDGAAAATVDAAVERRIPLRGKRRVIARRMVESLRTSAQLTSVLEIDVEDMVEWRSQREPRPSYTAIFVAIAARALRRHALLNSRLAGDEIELLRDVNIAFAVHTDDGVAAPVIRGADALPLAEIDLHVAELTERARAGTLTLADVEAATFTLSNSGSASVDITTAIIDPPQCAILWIGRIRERAVVRDGAVVARPTVQACLTYDHRIVDGVPAAEFLATIEEFARSFPGSALASGR